MFVKRKYPGVFNSETYEKQDGLEFYINYAKPRYKLVKTDNFGSYFFDSNFHCAYCPTFGVDCDFEVLSFDLKGDGMLKKFLDHIKDTELALERFLIRLPTFPIVCLLEKFN